MAREAVTHVLLITGRPGVGKTTSVCLVDKIGTLECISPAFVALRGGGFIGEVTQRTDTDLLEVTHGTRDELPGRVRAWLGRRTR